jgi:hypothetical protein
LDGRIGRPLRVVPTCDYLRFHAISRTCMHLRAEAWQQRPETPAFAKATADKREGPSKDALTLPSPTRWEGGRQAG